MSSIPTKQIDGDVAVGRNVSAGGDANIQGNARVGHDLIVEGWLEAKNIKGVNKGLFASAAALREAYPSPRTGWYAIVGDTLPGALYVGLNGTWVSTGKTAGTITLEVKQFQEELKDIESRMSDFTESIDKLKRDTRGMIDAAIKGLGKGEAGGIAPLNSEGKIDNKYLPESARDVIVFDHIAEDVGEIAMSSSSHSSTDAGCSLVYNVATESFVLRATEFGRTSYFSNWNDANKYGEIGGAQGWRPYRERLYICRGDKGLYVKSISGDGLERLSGGGGGISATDIATAGEIEAVGDAVFGD